MNFFRLMHSSCSFGYPRGDVRTTSDGHISRVRHAYVDTPVAAVKETLGRNWTEFRYSTTSFYEFDPSEVVDRYKIGDTRSRRKSKSSRNLQSTKSSKKYYQTHLRLRNLLKTRKSPSTERRRPRAPTPKGPTPTNMTPNHPPCPMSLPRPA